MTATTWYRAGTATVTNNSRPVVGVNTAWLSQVSAGDLFAVTDANGNLTSVWAEIESVTDDTHLTLKAIWPAATASGAKYAILRNFTGVPPAVMAARLSKLIAQFQCTVDEMTALLRTSDMVTLTTLTGETVQVQGLLGIAQQSVPAHEAKTGAHPISGVAGLAEALAGKRGNSDVVGVAQGGTGATDAAAARSALGALASVNPTSSGMMTHSGASRIRGAYAEQYFDAADGTNAAAVSVDAATKSYRVYTEGVKRYETVAGRHLFGPVTDDGSTLMQVGGGARFTGNVGIGVTPPIMSGSSVAAQRAVFGSLAGGPYSHAHMASNCYPSGSNDPGSATWRYNSGATGDLGDATLYEQRSRQHYFRVAATQGLAGEAITWNTAVVIDSSGNLLAGVWSGSCHTLWKTAAAEVGNGVLDVGGANSTAIFYSVSSFSPNSANAAVKLGRDATTGRSINAGGTINASGADYAEYERNNGATITKGDIVGFNVDGVLTTKFDDALSFGVKSTDPCMVGGDVWGTEDQVGKRPEQPQFTAPEYAGSQAPADLLAKPVEPSLGIPAEPSKQEGETKAVFAARKAWWQQAYQAAEAQHLQAQADYADALAAWEVQADEYTAALAQHQADQAAHQAAVEAAKAEFNKVTMPAYKKALAKFEAALEAARQTVDRVAYSGKVPVNVWDAKPGDYIVPVRADNGGIAGVAVGEDEISFAQYRKAVGRVRRIEPDGRALIAVIVH